MAAKLYDRGLFCNTARRLLDVGEEPIDLAAGDGGRLVQVRDVLVDG
jgi:hypothetical protein